MRDPPMEPDDVHSDGETCPECGHPYGDWDGECRNCEEQAQTCEVCGSGKRVTAMNFTVNWNEYKVLCEDCFEKKRNAQTE
jgi:hypothetical protein